MTTPTMTPTAWMRSRSAAVLLSLLLLAACNDYVSIASVVTPGNQIDDPRLLDTWQASDGSTVVVSRSGNGYSLLSTNEDGSIRVSHGQLGRVGPLTIFEMQSDEPPPAPGYGGIDNAAGYYRHVIVDSVDAGLHVRVVDGDSLWHYLQREPGAVPHQQRYGSMVITATAAQLQQFLLAFIRRPGATIPLDFVRLPAPRVSATVTAGSGRYATAQEGVCQHSDDASFYSKSASLWHAGFSADSSSPDSLSNVDLAVWQATGGLTWFSLSVEYGTGKETRRIELPPQHGASVRIQDSAIDLQAGGVTVVGDSVRISLSCSPVTELHHRMESD